MLNWLPLTTEQEFHNLYEQESPFAVFKHSTRCSISSMAKNRIEKEWNLDIPIYYLDLIEYRSVSNDIATTSGIHHESPQLIVFKDKTVAYHASHNFIFVNDIVI
ncbi:MAG: bacillithiol system redox-active protein YtxJ [Chitinophagales bacterium]|nr:bacillithiol system redox-active protein YtxJ [Chitinophagales bacterium]